MSHENFAGNIIVNLANLPDFLRKPMLKKRMLDFFNLSIEDKREVIFNALEAGPQIPFPNFSKLFFTWLESLAEIPEEKRSELIQLYIEEILKNPQKIILFHLDGIFEVFKKLEKDKKTILSNSILKIYSNLESQSQKKFQILTPDIARRELGI